MWSGGKVVEERLQRGVIGGGWQSGEREIGFTLNHYLQELIFVCHIPLLLQQLFKSSHYCTMEAVQTGCCYTWSQVGVANILYSSFASMWRKSSLKPWEHVVRSIWTILTV